MTHNEFDEHMTIWFEDTWVELPLADQSKIFGTVCDIWRDLAIGDDADEESLVSLFCLTSLTEKQKVDYRTYLSEAGAEYTPLQVDMLCEAVRYAFEVYDSE